MDTPGKELVWIEWPELKAVFHINKALNATLTSLVVYTLNWMV